MQEQNFEKQVQQKMEELSFTPSSPVWQKVEKEIRRKRERRRIIFWFLPLLLVSGIGFWWLHSRPVQQDTASLPTPDKTINEVKPSLNQQETLATKTNGHQQKGFEKVGTEKEIIPLSEPSLIRKKSDQTENAVVFEKEKSKKDAPPLSINGFEKVDNKVDNIVRRENKKVADNDFINHPDGDLSPSNKPVPAIDSAQEPAPDTLVSIISQNNDPVPDTSNVVNDTLETNSSMDSISIVSAKEKKWFWSAQLHTGISGVNTNPFRLSNPSSSMYLYEAALPLQNSAAFGPQPVSEVHTDFSVSAGASVYRRLTKKVSLTAGLHYHYYSTWNHVGQQVANDTNIIRNADLMALSRYYRSSSSLTSKYNNRYHFIEVPVGIQILLFKNNRLQLQPGVSVAYLLHTNAVYFNQQARIYYRDKNVFNRTFLSAYSGLTYQAFTIGTASLHIGPYAQFNVTNLLNKNTSGRQHLYFAGLTTKVSFK